MSEHKKPRTKKPVSTKEENEFPAEVIVYDCIMHERCVVEYRNESKWWYGTRLYKVYHPNFKEALSEQQRLAGETGHRWVTKLGKTLGGFDPTESVPAQEEVST